MRFLKVHDGFYVRDEDVRAIKVDGIENKCRVSLRIAGEPDLVTYGLQYYQRFREADEMADMLAKFLSSPAEPVTGPMKAVDL